MRGNEAAHRKDKHARAEGWDEQLSWKVAIVRLGRQGTMLKSGIRSLGWLRMLGGRFDCVQKVT